MGAESEHRLKLYRLRWLFAAALCSAFLLTAGRLLSTPLFAAERVDKLCPQVVLEGGKAIGLTDLEKRLVCGDPDGKGANAEAWRHIPLSQSRYQVGVFLEKRGYYAPKFRTEKGVLHIELGEVTRVRSWRMEGAPPEFVAKYLTRKRKVVGEVLTPELLTTLEQWVFGRLQSEGYACPKLRSKADSETGEVVVRVDPGSQYDLTRMIEEPIPGVEEGMMRRYDAFVLGERFNRDLLTLTERRIQRQGVVQSMHFKIRCEKDGAVATQESLAGAPRLVSVGFGANTEGLLLAKATWSNQRFGRKASSLSLTGLASYREVSAQGSSAWYYLDHPSRLYLKPTMQLRRRTEVYFQELGIQGVFPIARTWDSQSDGWSAMLGPSYEYYRTLQGVGPDHSEFLSLAAEVSWGTHELEFYRNAPRSGSTGTISSFTSGKNAISSVVSERFRLSGQALWNFNNYDPPLWIFAVRGSFGVTWTPDTANYAEILPPSFRQYLGGAHDLRGFGRLELPVDTVGSLSAAYVGGEIRLVTVFPFGVEPFVFLDLGTLSKQQVAIQWPLYWSPGLGARWDSPVGSFRGTLAHGYVTGGAPNRSDGTSVSHFQFYVSFGEEF